MWPMLLDMTEEESIQGLRHLELEAYSSLVSALRAQGSLNQDKRRILKETSTLLNISSERHKAEIRRATSDEKLNTIAYHITGRLNSLEDWAQEGRRLIPLLPRTPPQTPYSFYADEASDIASQCNKQLPFPANTERKRAPPQSVCPTVVTTEASVKPATFRIPEVPKDESKKRRCHSLGENSSLAQHLLSPKLSKIQQIYRQATKAAKQKAKDSELENADLNKKPTIPSRAQQPAAPIVNNSRINIIQNISIPCAKEDALIMEEKITKENTVITPSSVNENKAPIVSKALNLKQNNAFPNKQSANVFTTEAEQAIDPAKLCITKKTINKGQKLIVVSNASTQPSNSILQKTLSVPISKLTKLNLDKFKFVSNNQLPSALQVTSAIANQNIVMPKPKLVSIKGNSGKKVIPLSQLQMLNPNGNLKVVPYCGKLMDKNLQVADSRYRRTMLPINKNNLEDITRTTSVCTDVIQSEKIRTDVNGLVKDEEKPIDDFESRINEFRIAEVNCNELDLESSESLSSESSELDDRQSNGDSNIEFMEVDHRAFLESRQDDEILEEFEVIHTEKLLQ